MAYEHKENSGSLFRNDGKKTDNHPDYTGKLNIAGQMWDVSGWIKDSNGKKWLSLSAREPNQADTTETASGTIVADDLPF